MWVGINFILSLVLMPFFLRRRGIINVCKFLVICSILTPLFGIPVYKMLGGR
jgi:hypothetical protein